MFTLQWTLPFTDDDDVSVDDGDGAVTLTFCSHGCPLDVRTGKGGPTVTSGVTTVVFASPRPPLLSH